MRASTLLGFKTPLAQRPCYRSTSEKLRTNYQRSLRAGCSLNALNKGSTRWEGRSRERSTSCEKNGDSTKGLVVLQVCLAIFGTVCRFLAHLGSRDKRIYFLLFLTAICALFKFSTNLTQARVGKAGCSKIYSNSRRVATALLKIESTHCHCTWNSSSAHWPQVDCNSLTASARVAALALDALGWAGPSRLPVADEVDPRRHAPWAAPRPK